MQQTNNFSSLYVKDSTKNALVLNLECELKGIVSMSDIVLRAKERNGKKPQIAYADVVKTYQAICEHPLPMVQAAPNEKGHGIQPGICGYPDDVVPMPQET